jgi:hypothetical protein
MQEREARTKAVPCACMYTVYMTCWQQQTYRTFSPENKNVYCLIIVQVKINLIKIEMKNNDSILMLIDQSMVYSCRWLLLKHRTLEEVPLSNLLPSLCWNQNFAPETR